jgi:hypothetical protein
LGDFQAVSSNVALPMKKMPISLKKYLSIVMMKICFRHLQVDIDCKKIGLVKWQYLEQHHPYTRCAPYHLPQAPKSADNQPQILRDSANPINVLHQNVIHSDG